MTLYATCPSCGQQFEAEPRLAGQVLPCPACGAQMQVPAAAGVAPIQTPLLTPAPQQPAPMPQSAPQPAPVSQPAPIPSVQSITESTTPAASAPEMDRLVAGFNEATQSEAARPGRLRVNYLRFVTCFPKWPGIFLGCLLFALLLMLLHWAFVFLALPFVALLVFHYRRTKSHFIGGCINPGMVVSPELIAVSTNLSRGDDCPVIKISKHPVARLAGATQVGAPFPAVATYGSVEPAGDHWNDIDAFAGQIATTDQAEVNRMLGSLDEEEWRELQIGLTQIEQPYQPGLYRIFPTPKPLAPGAIDLPTLAVDVLPHDPDREHYLAAHGIPPEVAQIVFGGFAAGVDINRVLALFGHRYNDNHENGLLLTMDGLVYRFPKIGEGRLPWSEIHGAMFGWFELQIVHGQTYQRLRMKETTFNGDVCWPIEHFINAACGLDVTG